MNEGKGKTGAKRPKMMKMNEGKLSAQKPALRPARPQNLAILSHFAPK